MLELVIDTINVIIDLISETTHSARIDYTCIVITAAEIFRPFSRVISTRSSAFEEGAAVISISARQLRLQIVVRANEMRPFYFCVCVLKNLR